MLMGRHPVPCKHLRVQHLSFEQMEDFKCLDVNINHKNIMHNEIKSRKSSPKPRSPRNE
jgi:hypothetical protein